MKLPALFSFSDSQRKTLARVVKFSVTCMVLLVAGVWIVQTLKARKVQKNHEETSSALAGDVTKMEKGAEDLLGVDVEALELAARHYLDTDQPDKALPYLLRLHARSRFDRRIGRDVGTAYLDAGRFPQALGILKKLLDEEVSDSLTPSIGARYGRALFYSGKTRESLEFLEKLRVQYPASSEILCYLGEAETARDPSSAKAEEYLREAVKLDPLHSEARYQLARYLMGAGRQAECRDSLLALLSNEPLHVRAHSRLGMVYYYLKEFDMALKAYQTALALNPSDYNTHYNLGELFLSAYDDPRKALVEFRKTVALKPDHAEANFKIGLLCLGNNMYKEAALYLQRARQEQPRNIRVLLQLAVAFEKINSTADALETYRAISELDPLNEVARQKMALLTGGKE